MSGVLGVFLSGILLFGCSQVSQRPPQEAIRDGIKKFLEVSSYSFVASVNGDFSTSQGEGPKNVKLSMNTKGAFEGKDTKDLHLNLQLDTNVTADNSKVDGSFEIRLQKDMVYFLISKLSTTPEQGQNPFAQYLSKWYNIQIPAEFMKQLEDISAKNTDAQLSPEQKQIKDLYEHTNFLTNPVLAGTEDINGESSTHFKADLDKKAVVDFAKKVAEIQGTKTTQADLDQFQAFLDKLAVSTIELWIGNSHGYLDQVQVNFQSQPHLSEQQNGTLTLKATFSDFGKPVTIEIPKDSVPFPVLDFFLGPSVEVPSGSSNETPELPSDKNSSTPSTPSKTQK